jgi:hypothetical protein
MKRVIHSRYSPAIVVAILVALVAVAGIAIAGPATESKKKGLTAAKVRAIADREIAKKAPGLTVGTANNVSAGGLKQVALKGTTIVTLDFGSIAAQTCAVLNGPVTGVGPSDSVIATPDQNINGSITLRWNIPGAPDTVRFQACNPTTGAIDPAAFTVRVNVIGP